MSLYDETDLNYDSEETPPEEASNRTFLIAAGVLGGIVLLSIACLAVYALVIMPQRNAAVQDQTVNAEETQMAQVNDALTATQYADFLSQTPQATETLFPTDTPVVAQPAATNTVPVEAAAGTEAAPANGDVTATVIAGLTQVASATAATAMPTSTGLPTSGFADEVGLPGLVIGAMVLVAVIFLARRLRAVPTR